MEPARLSERRRTVDNDHRNLRIDTSDQADGSVCQEDEGIEPRRDLPYPLHVRGFGLDACGRIEGLGGRHVLRPSHPGPHGCQWGDRILRDARIERYQGSEDSGQRIGARQQQAGRVRREEVQDQQGGRRLHQTVRGVLPQMRPRGCRIRDEPRSEEILRIRNAPGPRPLRRRGRSLHKRAFGREDLPFEGCLHQIEIRLDAGKTDRRPDVQRNQLPLGRLPRPGKGG